MHSKQCSKCKQRSVPTPRLLFSLRLRRGHTNASHCEATTMWGHCRTNNERWQGPKFIWQKSSKIVEAWCMVHTRASPNPTRNCGRGAYLDAMKFLPQRPP
eukprot:EG_transcript_50944